MADFLSRLSLERKLAPMVPGRALLLRAVASRIYADASSRSGQEPVSLSRVLKFTMLSCPEIKQ